MKLYYVTRFQYSDTIPMEIYTGAGIFTPFEEEPIPFFFATQDEAKKICETRTDCNWESIEFDPNV